MIGANVPVKVPRSLCIHRSRTLTESVKPRSANETEILAGNFAFAFAAAASAIAVALVEATALVALAV